MGYDTGWTDGMGLLLEVEPSVDHNQSPDALLQRKTNEVPRTSGTPNTLVTRGDNYPGGRIGTT